MVLKFLCLVLLVLLATNRVTGQFFVGGFEDDRMHETMETIAKLKGELDNKKTNPERFELKLEIKCWEMKLISSDPESICKQDLASMLKMYETMLNTAKDDLQNATDEEKYALKLEIRYWSEKVLSSRLPFLTMAAAQHMGSPTPGQYDLWLRASHYGPMDLSTPQGDDELIRSYVSYQWAEEVLRGFILNSQNGVFNVGTGTLHAQETGWYSVRAESLHCVNAFDETSQQVDLWVNYNRTEPFIWKYYYPSSSCYATGAVYLQKFDTMGLQATYTLKKEGERKDHAWFLNFFLTITYKGK